MTINPTFSIFYGRVSVLGYMVTGKNEDPIHCPYVEVIYNNRVRIATVFVGNGQYEPLSCSLTSKAKKDKFHSPFISTVLDNLDEAFHPSVTNESQTFVKLRRLSSNY